MGWRQWEGKGHLLESRVPGILTTTGRRADGGTGSRSHSDRKVLLSREAPEPASVLALP